MDLQNIPSFIDRLPRKYRIPFSVAFLILLLLLLILINLQTGKNIIDDAKEKKAVGAPVEQISIPPASVKSDSVSKATTTGSIDSNRRDQPTYNVQNSPGTVIGDHNRISH